MNIPIRTLFAVLTLCFAFSICDISIARGNDPFTVVLDAGHGGKSPGAVSGNVLEKTINLELALALGKLIEENMTDVRVVYTRTDDRDVGLAERGSIANRADADLFISIHINALANASANGTSTWVMGTEKNEANLQEAMRENEVIRYEDDYEETYAGFDPGSAESYIMLRLLQYAHFDRSLQFAHILQKHYAAGTTMRDRGAEQGPFLVLWKAAMPAVLTEVGFISNESDRRYITSKAGQARIARALYDAFGEYRSLVERPVASTTTTAAAGESTTKADLVARYYVQLSASRTRLDADDRAFGEYRRKVVEHTSGGWYRYSIGPFDTQDEADRKQREARRNGFREAFIKTITE